jgi:hypothetical protein
LHDYGGEGVEKEEDTEDGRSDMRETMENEQREERRGGRRNSSKTEPARGRPGEKGGGVGTDGGEEGVER